MLVYRNWGGFYSLAMWGSYHYDFSVAALSVVGDLADAPVGTPTTDYT